MMSVENSARNASLCSCNGDFSEHNGAGIVVMCDQVLMQKPLVHLAKNKIRLYKVHPTPLILLPQFAITIVILIPQ